MKTFNWDGTLGLFFLSMLAGIAFIGIGFIPFTAGGILAMLAPIFLVVGVIIVIVFAVAIILRGLAVLLNRILR